MTACSSAYRAQEKTAGGHHHPRQRPGKPQEGEIVSRAPASRRGRDDHPTRRKGGRSHPVRQMDGHRSQDRRRRPVDHEGKRCAWHIGLSDLLLFLPILFFESQPSWQPETSNSRVTHANASCAVSISSPTRSRSRSVPRGQRRARQGLWRAADHKDGVTVAKESISRNKFENMGAQMIARSLEDAGHAGDGTPPRPCSPRRSCARDEVGLRGRQLDGFEARHRHRGGEGRRGTGRRIAPGLGQCRDCPVGIVSAMATRKSAG